MFITIFSGGGGGESAPSLFLWTISLKDRWIMDSLKDSGNNESNLKNEINRLLNNFWND